MIVEKEIVWANIVQLNAIKDLKAEFTVVL